MSRPPIKSALLLTLLLAGITPALAPAQRLLDWGSRQSGPATPQSAPTDPQTWMRLQCDGAICSAWVSNPTPGPAQLQLDAPSADGYRAVPELPLTLLLRAHEQRLATHLYLVDPGSSARIKLRVQAVPGSPAATAQDIVYQLPFAGAPIHVDQGFNGSFSHHDDANRYALDFALPEGTPVLAARGGIVLQVQGSFHDAGADREHYGGRANVIRILHADGSMAVYAHLSPDGIAVHEGDSVSAGQRIALSGNTGFSTAPHLHFALQLNRGLRLVSVPFRMAGPKGELRFANSTPNAPDPAGSR